MNLKRLIPTAAALTVLPMAALAQDAAPGFDEIGPYIMTTLLFCMAGFLVFFMAAGFAMLEGGLVRSKNVTMQMTKNIALFSIAAIMYWLVGFNTMYPGDFNGYFAIGGQTVLDPVGVAAADAALAHNATMPSEAFIIPERSPTEQKGQGRPPNQDAIKQFPGDNAAQKIGLEAHAGAAS